MLMIEPPWEFGPAAAISRSLWNWSMTLISSETASGFPQIWEKKIPNPTPQDP